MNFMFYDCTSFNQSLDAWKINPVVYAAGMVGILINTPAFELPFVEKWRAVGGISEES